MKLQTFLWFSVLISSFALQGVAQLFGYSKPTPWWVKNVNKLWFALFSFEFLRKYLFLRFQRSGRYGIWRCGDWRSKFRIIDCNNPNNPIIDFPPGYDIKKLQNMPRRWNYIPGIGQVRFGGGTPLVRMFGVPVYGYPDVYRESDYDD